ncbi:MAG TPA: TetR/AcrR family transcriptional regulator [Ktedonobacterales bacterium]
MDARSAEVAATGQRILHATTDLYMERWLEDLTLEDVAARAGVTVQTVLRRFGSKAELIREAGEGLYAQVVAQRGQAPIGDIPGAVANLMTHYEETGDLTIRTLAQEGKHDVLHAFAAQGRAVHRSWVETSFAPFLNDHSEAQRIALLTKLIVATDIYVWKLLRRDMGLGRDQTERYIAEIVSAIIESAK